MNGDQWRDPQPRPCPECGYEWPADNPNLVPERLELVERIVGAELRAKVAERALRERMAHPEDTGLVLAQQARIVELEAGMERQAARIAHLNRRTA